jgi:hypothetical protein
MLNCEKNSAALRYLELCLAASVAEGAKISALDAYCSIYENYVLTEGGELEVVDFKRKTSQAISRVEWKFFALLN